MHWGQSAVIGACVAWIAWQPEWPLWSTWVLVLLPALWAAAPSRGRAISAIAAYLLVGTRDIPTITHTFFPSLPWIVGDALWFAQALMLIIPWCWLWRPGMAPADAAWRAALAVLLVTIPPFGCVGWLTPIALAGGLFPGWSWVALGLALAILASAAALARDRTCRSARMAMLILCTLSAVAVVIDRPASVPKGWVAVSTRLGHYPRPDDLMGRLARQQALLEIVLQRLSAPEVRVVILPEEIAGLWEPAFALAWKSVEAIVRERKVTVLVGADDIVSDKRFDDRLFAIGEPELELGARVPMPIGLWRPWTTPSASIDLARGHQATLHGARASFVFCFEDFLFWLQALTMLEDRPDVLVSVANNWFARDLAASGIQARHIALQARLWGLPLVRAVNLSPSRSVAHGP